MTPEETKELFDIVDGIVSQIYFDHEPEVKWCECCHRPVCQRNPPRFTHKGNCAVEEYFEFKARIKQ